MAKKRQPFFALSLTDHFASIDKFTTANRENTKSTEIKAVKKIQNFKKNQIKSGK